MKKPILLIFIIVFLFSGYYLGKGFSFYENHKFINEGLSDIDVILEEGASLASESKTNIKYDENQKIEREIQEKEDSDKERVVKQDINKKELNDNIPKNNKDKVINKNNINDSISDDEKKDTINNITHTENVIKDVESVITFSDKLKVTRLILSRLSISDINLLKSFLSDGLTVEEKKKAKDIAYDRFSEKELIVLQNLYKKYLK